MMRDKLQDRTSIEGNNKMDQGWVKYQQSECSDLFRAVPGVVYRNLFFSVDRGPVICQMAFE